MSEQPAPAAGQTPTSAERARIRSLASRWAEIAALPLMAERKRAWTALHDLRPERPMVLFEVGTVDQYVREDELTCAHPVMRAVEATMLEHIHHFDEVGDDIVFEPYYRLGWDIRDSGWGVDVIQIPGPAAADGTSIGYTFNFPLKTPADVERLRPRQFSLDREGTLGQAAAAGGHLRRHPAGGRGQLRPLHDRRRCRELGRQLLHRPDLADLPLHRQRRPAELGLRVTRDHPSADGVHGRGPRTAVRVPRGAGPHRAQHGQHAGRALAPTATARTCPPPTRRPDSSAICGAGPSRRSRRPSARPCSTSSCCPTSSA